MNSVFLYQDIFSLILTKWVVWLHYTFKLGILSSLKALNIQPSSRIGLNVLIADDKLICKYSISTHRWGSGVCIELQMIYVALAWGVYEKYPAAFGQRAFFLGTNGHKALLWCYSCLMIFVSVALSSWCIYTTMQVVIVQFQGCPALRASIHVIRTQWLFCCLSIKGWRFSDRTDNQVGHL